MWYSATVIEAPASEPVALAQVKAQLRIAVSDTSRDVELQQLIAAARSHVERYCAIRLVTQTVQVSCDSFEDFERLSQAPLQAVNSISYFDEAGAEQEIDLAECDVRKEDLAPCIARKFGKGWPAKQGKSRITMIAVVGFQQVPADIVAALLLTVAKLAAFSREDLLIRTEQVEDVGSTTYAGAVEVSGALDSIARDLLENYRNWAL